MVLEIVFICSFKHYAVPRKKLGDFTYYLDNLGIHFTFIGVCQTWATQLNEDLLNLPGYKHKHYIRSNKRRGRVSIYILNTIPYKTRNKYILFNARIRICVYIN